MTARVFPPSWTDWRSRPIRRRSCDAKRQGLPFLLIALAILVRTTSLSLRRLRFGHGSTMPGRLARFLVPDLLPRVAALPFLRVVLVSGTNGKTTTVHILHHLLTGAGWRAESNLSGANLETGLLTAILARLPFRVATGATVTFILEIDEAALAHLAERLHPRLVVLTNFCRDQLDRYGELDHVAAGIGNALDRVGSALPVVLNADDPAVSALGPDRPATYYGLETTGASCDWASPLEHFTCPACRVDLVYRQIYLGHCGDWYCPSCGQGRPARRIAAARIREDEGTGGSTFLLRLGGDEAEVRLPLLGLHNVYNALAAAGAAAQLGLTLPMIAQSLSSVTPCFGRGERVRFGPRELHLFLIKNPAGANTVLDTLSRQKVQDIWFIINDRTADGRDVSWLWDVDFEGFWTRNGYPARVAVSGRRALDLAVRFRYSELPEERLRILPRIRRGLKQVAAENAGTCFVLATYTSLLELRDRLHKAVRW